MMTRGGVAERRYAKRLPRLAIALALLGVVFLWLIDPAVFLEQVLDCSPLALLAAALGIIGGRLVVAWRWHLLVRSTHPAIAFGELARLVLMGSSLSFVGPGIVGTEAYRVAGLARWTGVGVAVASVVVERLTSLLGLVALIGLGLVLAELPMADALQLFLVLGCLGIVFGIALLFARPLHRRLGSFVRYLPSRVAGSLNRLIGAISAYSGQPTLLVHLAGLSVLLQSLRVASSVALAMGLGIEAGLGVLLVVVPIGLMISMLPLTPQGLGTRELAYVALLGGVGVGAEQAVALSLLYTGTAAVVLVLPALWFYMLHGIWGTARPAAIDKGGS